MNLTVEALPQFTQFFEQIRVLGIGGNSTVILVAQKGTTNLYAAKISSPGVGSKQALINQAQNLANLSNDHSPLIQYFGLFRYQMNIPVMITEYIEGVPLTKQIFSEETLTRMMIDLLIQLKYLHERGKFHGDIHRGNIMINNHRAMLIDIHGDDYPDSSWTIVYPDELRTTKEWFSKLDRPLEIYFPKKDIYELGEALKPFVQPNSHMERAIDAMMDPDPRARPTADQLLELFMPYSL